MRRHKVVALGSFSKKGDFGGLAAGVRVPQAHTVSIPSGSGIVPHLSGPAPVVAGGAEREFRLL